MRRSTTGELEAEAWCHVHPERQKYWKIYFIFICRVLRFCLCVTKQNVNNKLYLTSWVVWHRISSDHVWPMLPAIMCLYYFTHVVTCPFSCQSVMCSSCFRNSYIMMEIFSNFCVFELYHHCHCVSILTVFQRVRSQVTENTTAKYVKTQSLF